MDSKEIRLEPKNADQELGYLKALHTILMIDSIDYETKMKVYQALKGNIDGDM